MEGFCNFDVIVCPDCGKRRTKRHDNLYSLSGGFMGRSDLCDDCKSSADAREQARCEALEAKVQRIRAIEVVITELLKEGPLSPRDIEDRAKERGFSGTYQSLMNLYHYGRLTLNDNFTYALKEQVSMGRVAD